MPSIVLGHLRTGQNIGGECPTRRLGVATHPPAMPWRDPCRTGIVPRTAGRVPLCRCSPGKSALAAGNVGLRWRVVSA